MYKEEKIVWGALLSIGSTVASAIGSALSGALRVLETVCTAIQVICKILGVGKPDEKIEDIGDRAIQAEEAGIVPENFDTYEEYRRKVDEFKIDSEKSKEITLERKLLKGIELQVIGLENKYPQIGWGTLIQYAATNPEYFTPKRMEHLGEVLKKNPERVEDIATYLQGEEKNEDKFFDTQDLLKEIEKNIDPALSDKAIAEYVKSLVK